MTRRNIAQSVLDPQYCRVFPSTPDIPSIWNRNRFCYAGFQVSGSAKGRIRPKPCGGFGFQISGLGH